jgi:hypothetical protein
MFKKKVSIIVVIVFVLFTYSCSRLPEMVLIDRVKPAKWEDNRVLGLVTMSGKWVEFKAPDYGRVMLNKITGYVYVDGRLRPASIPFSNIRQVWTKRYSGGAMVKDTIAVFGALAVTWISYLLIKNPDFM